MKDKLIYFFTCLGTNILLFIVEFMVLSFIFTLLNWNGYFVPFIYVFLLIFVNPFITWILANEFYNKIQTGNSSDK